MAKMYVREPVVKEIIERLYERSEVAGLICELCWVRNFRVGDVRLAKLGHFKKVNGHSEFYLCYDKCRSHEWYPIPNYIYHKIMHYASKHNITDDNRVFEITQYKDNPRVGVITHEWILKMWYDICKELGIYTETARDWRDCVNCKYAAGKKKCKILGNRRIRNRTSVHIKHCIRKGKTRTITEKHPRLHETLRASSTQEKIQFYLDQGLDYENALLKVFHMSNWKSLKVFRSYLDPIFEKEIGDNTYIKDFGDKILIPS